MGEQTTKDSKKELYLAMHKAQEMLDLTQDGFSKNKLSSFAESDMLAGEIHMREETLIASLAKMAPEDTEARALLCVPAHIENIVLGIRRITEDCRARTKHGLLFSDKAVQETVALFTTAKSALKNAGDSLVTGSLETAENAVRESDAVARMAREAATAHEERLVVGACHPKSCSLYLGMLYAFEDISMHVKYAVRRLCVK